MSLDARMDGLEVDMGRFYSLAGTWREDCTLVGSETLLAGMPELANAGEAVLHPSVAKLLIRDYLTRVEHGEEISYDTLSDREREILKLIAEGRTNKEIAELLFLSVKTVQAHRANLMRKLGMHDRTELVKYAIRKGIIGLDEA